MIFMNPTMFISSAMSNISLPKRNPEAVANWSWNPKHNILAENFELAGFEKLDWKFLTASGHGSVEMVVSNKENNKIICIEIPATANFLAVCTRRQSQFYKLEFGISLSKPSMC